MITLYTLANRLGKLEYTVANQQCFIAGNLKLHITNNIYTTSAQLNTDFPNAILGFEVYKDGDDFIFKKISETTWAKVGIEIV